MFKSWAAKPYKIMMRALLASLVIICTLQFACSRERGFSITSGGDGNLYGNSGLIFWVDGVALRWGCIPSEKVGTRLLSMVLITPGAKRSISSGSSNSGGNTHKFDYVIGAGKDRVQTVIDWDKVADVLEIEGKTYDRADGTLFVIVKPLGQGAQVWQLRSRVVSPSGDDMVEQAKDELPDVEAVQTLTTSKSL